MKSGFYFYKVSIDFEYLNEIYSIVAEPYNTLIELKENIIKKIFPSPKNVHCFYQNLDIYEKENEQISRIFPFKKKIKIRLKNPSKEKKLIKPYNSYKYLDNRVKSNIIENKEIKIPKIEINSINSINSDSSIKFGKKIKIKNNHNHQISTKNIVKKRLLSFSSVAESINNPKERKRSQDTLESNGEEFYTNDELFYYLYKNKIKKLKLVNIDNNKDNINFNNNNDIITEEESIYYTERKPKKLNKLKINLNDIKINFQKDNDNINNDKCKTQREKEEIKILINNEVNNENKEINDENDIESFQISNENNENNQNGGNNGKNKNNNEINGQSKIIEDDNYICTLCKKNIVSYYCLKCNQFICKNCLEKCKSDNHENININLNEDSLFNINIYAKSLISNIDKKVNEIKQYDSELKIFDIKKRRDNIILMFNEIINLYSQITSILKNTYKEKDAKNEMSKYKLDSDRIKEEIKKIIKHAETYAKSDSNNNKPKFKIMNMKYFFDLINQQQNNHKLLTDKIKVFSLNSSINGNIEKAFNEIEEIMKKITNKENPFDLNDNLKDDYYKLIKEQRNQMRKKSSRHKSSKNANKMISHFPSIKSPDKNNKDNNKNNYNLAKENK